MCYYWSDNIKKVMVDGTYGKHGRYENTTLLSVILDLLQSEA